MLPLFFRGVDGKACFKPLLQLIFEQLFDVGVREYCFIVGKGKEIIKGHFTPDYDCVEQLSSMEKSGQASELKGFYKKLEESRLMWIDQPEPRGSGHAVLLSRPHIGSNDFFVHAGDTYVISQGNDYLKRLAHHHEKQRDDATLLVQEVLNPQRYGIIEGILMGQGFRVIKAVEKPSKPSTNLAIMSIYVFTPMIFKALEAAVPSRGCEHHLTDGIQKMIDQGLGVQAIKFEEGDVGMDIGTPEAYWRALKLSHEGSQY